MVLCGKAIDQEKGNYASYLFKEMSKFQKVGILCDVKVPGELQVVNAHRVVLMSAQSSDAKRLSDSSICSSSSTDSVDENQCEATETKDKDLFSIENAYSPGSDEVQCDNEQDTAGSPQERLDVLNDLRLHNCCCDVTIIADQQRCDVHKVVLAACSDYFKAMFTSNMKESAEKTITLHEMSSGLFRKVIDFMYSGQISMDTEESLELLKIAVYYQILPLVNRCQSFLMSHFSTNNCCYILYLARELALQDLHHKCLSYVFEHFMELDTELDQVELIHAQDLIHCVKSDFLGNNICNSETELHVLRVALYWLSCNLALTDHDTQRRIATNIRLALIEPNVLRSICQDPNTDLNNNNNTKMEDSYGPVFAEYLEKMLIYHDRLYEQPLSQSRTTQLRTSLRHWSCIDGVLAQNPLKLPSESRNVVHNVGNSAEDEEAGTPIRDPYHSVVELNGFLYVIGSTRKDVQTSYSRCVYRYDPRLDRKVRVADMGVERGDCVACVLGDYIYVIGGRNRHGSLSSCERYDPRMNVWDKMADLPQASYMAAGRSRGGFIYLSGGFNDYDTVGCTYQYNPEGDEWSEIYSPMLCDRGFHALVEGQEGCLWAIGGVDHPFSGRNVWEVEALDVIEDLWTFAGQILPIQPLLSTMRINVLRTDEGHICVFAVTTPHKFPMIEYVPEKAMWLEMSRRLTVCQVLAD